MGERTSPLAAVLRRENEEGLHQGWAPSLIS